MPPKALTPNGDSEFFFHLLGALAIGAGALFVWTMVGRAAKRARRRFEALLAQGDPDLQTHLTAAQRLTALQLVVNGTRYVLFGAAALLILSELNLLKSDSLIFPAGLVGAALGLGSQNLVRDVVAGLFIVFEGQFAVGDWVKINGVVGRVEEVGLRVTSVRDDTGQLHFFPNGAITTVARFPRRAVVLHLWVPLSKAKPRAEIEQLIELALADFGRIYNVWVTPPQVIESASELEMRFSLTVEPAQAPLVREKLPPRLTALLESNGANNEIGASVEITAAPVG